jgi:CheY-like chemotaxis protein
MGELAYDDGEQASMTILLVEDDPLQRAEMADHFRRAGARVLLAANATDAIVMLGLGERVDLVITDVRLGGRLDGLQLAQWVKQRLGLPVLVVSAYEQIPSPAVDEWRAKPILPDALVELALSMCSRRGGKM